MFGEIDPKREGSTMCRFCWREISRCICSSDLSPDSLETIEIEIAERPRDGIVWHYDPLPIACDLCIASVEIAVAQLGNPEVSSDLNVSEALAQNGWAADLLKHLPEKLYVNRLKVRCELSAHEWFIECGDGRCVGSAPPE